MIPDLVQEIDDRGRRLYWIVCSKHGRSPVAIRSTLAASRERWLHEVTCPRGRGWPRWMLRERDRLDAAGRR